MVKNPNNYEVLDDAENILCRIDEKRKRYNTNKAIFDAIKSDPEKDNKTGELFLQAIDQIIGRASTEQPEKLYDTISEMDAYYIPDDINLSDDDLCQILYGLLCRPQLMNFTTNPDGSKKRELKYEGLAKLNYILEGAAKHTMRQMEKNATVHSEEYLKATSGEKKEVGFWEPEERSKSMQHVSTNRYGLGYFKNQLKKRVEIRWSQKDKKYKVFFKISSLDDYLKFTRSLLSSQKEILDERGNTIAFQEKSFGRRQKDGLFLKNIIAFSDMEINDAYVGKRTHFLQLHREDFCPFLQINPSQIHIKELDNHEFEISSPFEIKDYGTVLKGRFVYCTKSQASMIDKTRRDINYSANKNLKDMIRGTIFMEKHEDLVLMMHRRVKYFIQNSESNFYHSLFNKQTHQGEDETSGFDPEHGILWGLSLKDKGILNTNIPNRIKNIKDLPAGTKPKNGKLIKDFTNDELNWAATQYLMNASKHEERKSRTSKEYQDSKLIEPELIRSDQMSQEFKFQLDKAKTKAEKGKTKEETKVKWQEDHRIRKLKQSFQLLSRDEKHINKEKIIHEAKLLLRDPELRRQIEEDIQKETRRGEEPENVENRLYRELITNLEQIKAEKTEKKSIETTEFCDKEIRKNLTENGYEPEI